jgi:hypothetical protein
MGSGEANVVKTDAGLDMDTGKVSGEVIMEVESPQDMDGFVVTDKQGNEAVMEELICVQENVVEKLKTLGPEQLVKATGLMGEALQSLGDSVAEDMETAAINVDSTDKTNDSAAEQNSAAQDSADPAASEKINSADAQGSTIGSSDKAAAEAMVLLSKKTTDVQPKSQSQPTQQPTQSSQPQSQQSKSTITPHLPRSSIKGVVIREPAA